MERHRRLGMVGADCALEHVGGEAQRLARLLISAHLSVEEAQVVVDRGDLSVLPSELPPPDPERTLETGEAPYWISVEQFEMTLAMIAKARQRDQIWISFDDGFVPSKLFREPRCVFSPMLTTG